MNENPKKGIKALELLNRGMSPNDAAKLLAEQEIEGRVSPDKSGLHGSAAVRYAGKTAEDRMKDAGFGASAKVQFLGEGLWKVSERQDRLIEIPMANSSALKPKIGLGKQTEEKKEIGIYEKIGKLWISQIGENGGPAEKKEGGISQKEEVLPSDMHQQVFDMLKRSQKIL